MLDYAIMQPEGILVLKPQAPLGQEDFTRLGAAVDAYLHDHATLHGVLVQAPGFPGWESWGGFIAHLQFVRGHHEKVERVAIVTDSPLAAMAESLGRHFIAAEIRHFPFAGEAQALDWLKRV